jgi:Acetyltransferase (GNAT) domain
MAPLPRRVLIEHAIRHASRVEILLETERLVLRRFTEGDGDNLVELDADPEVYATEGSRALVHVGFAELGAEQIVASTMVVNVASRHVMEKAGPRFVRTFHQPWPYTIEGEGEGDVEFALLRSEWEQELSGTDRVPVHDELRPR